MTKKESKHRQSLLTFFLAVLFSSFSFLTQAQKTDLLELPRLEKGERLIQYGGYDDVRYSSEDKKALRKDEVGYSLVFDEVHRIPKWVAYELTQEETSGAYSRSGKSFRQDSKAGISQADSYDYNFKLNGWTKGHMAPAGDFKWSDKAMTETFLFTNCCPQDETMNSGCWQKLEDKARAMARRYGSVYVVTGPVIGQERMGRIGKNRISVPDAFFKAFLVYDKKARKYHSIAFVMENSAKTQSLASSMMSVDSLEALLGMDLFPGLDDTVENVVETDCDPKDWSIR